MIFIVLAIAAIIGLGAAGYSYKNPSAVTKPLSENGGDVGVDTPTNSTPSKTGVTSSKNSTKSKDPSIVGPGPSRNELVINNPTLSSKLNKGEELPPDDFPGLLSEQAKQFLKKNGIPKFPTKTQNLPNGDIPQEFINIKNENDARKIGMKYMEMLLSHKVPDFITKLAKKGWIEIPINAVEKLAHTGMMIDYNQRENKKKEYCTELNKQIAAGNILAKNPSTMDKWSPASPNTKFSTEVITLDGHNVSHYYNQKNQDKSMPKGSFLMLDPSIRCPFVKSDPPPKIKISELSPRLKGVKSVIILLMPAITGLNIPFYKDHDKYENMKPPATPEDIIIFLRGADNKVYTFDKNLSLYYNTDFKQRQSIPGITFTKEQFMNMCDTIIKPQRYLKPITLGRSTF